ncbi:hypothetical protein [Paraburkholderia acidipaludis]|uniref:hypothetical protein n=1 Tax=Paraburkholderia acidipaludis TaxID=660537 RepID=UPI0012EB281C|nr:hypothetical protein [Paraburkholderia acidipaludis]
MAIPSQQIILVNKDGDLIAVDQIIEELRNDESRVLADDAVGLVVYVGDLDIYQLTPIETGEFLSQKVTQISRPRFSTKVLRRQIGARVMSITSDAVFIVRDGDILKKIRAEKLSPGMVLASGEKVFR